MSEPPHDDTPDTADATPAPAATPDASSTLPPPGKAHRRTVFRLRDDVGLVILAAVVTAIVWSVARQAVVEVHPPIARVAVTWIEHNSANQRVVWDDASPTITIRLKCSEPEYQILRRKLHDEGVKLRTGPLSVDERDLYTDAGDQIELPFDDSLLAEPIEPPGGTLIRVESATAVFENPEIVDLSERGIGVRVLGIDPPTHTLSSVPVGVLEKEILPDKIEAEDLPIGDASKFGTTIRVPLSFERWMRRDGQQAEPDQARVDVVSSFKDGVVARIELLRVEQREFTGPLVYGLSAEASRDFTFEVQEKAGAGVEGQFIKGVLVGTREDLDWLENEGKGKWQFVLQIFAEGTEFPGASSKEGKPFPARMSWQPLRNPKDYPVFERIRFVPSPKQEYENLQVVVTRR